MEKLSKNKLWLLAIIEKQVKDINFGVVTFTMNLTDSDPDMKSLQITRSKRKKYGK